VPALRERTEDIPLLVQHFMALFNQKFRPKAPVTGIADDALDAMHRYPWPGNVRELSNSIEGALTFSGSSIIGLEDLPNAVAASHSGRTAQCSASNESVDALPNGSFAEAERELIARALKSTGGNKVQAAALLRISRKKLYAKIEKYGI
jgi:DNA-binding NtrC family response regulator